MSAEPPTCSVCSGAALCAPAAAGVASNAPNAKTADRRVTARRLVIVITLEPFHQLTEVPWAGGGGGAQRGPQHRLIARHQRFPQRVLRAFDDVETGDVGTTEDVGVDVVAARVAQCGLPRFRRRGAVLV